MQARSVEIGTWYKDLHTGNVFEVVAIDELADTIAVQMLEGELCEYDQDSWRDMAVRPVDEPGDWRHPFDQDIDGDSDAPQRLDHWDNPLDLIEPDLGSPFQGSSFLDRGFDDELH